MKTFHFAVTRQIDPGMVQLRARQRFQLNLFSATCVAEQASFLKAKVRLSANTDVFEPSTAQRINHLRAVEARIHHHIRVQFRPLTRCKLADELERQLDGGFFALWIVDGVAHRKAQLSDADMHHHQMNAFNAVVDTQIG